MPLLQKLLPDWPRCRRIVTALGVGAAGGALFVTLTAPIPWMLGAMCFTVALAFLRVPFEVPKLLRMASLMMVGLLLGSAFTPDILDRIGAWAGAIALNLVYLMCVVAIGTVYFRKVAGHDPASAYFSSTPGGLIEMPFLAEAFGGSARDVSLAHALRIVVVILAIPIYLRLTEGALFLASARASSAAAGSIGLADALILIATALAGYWLAKLCRVPAPPLIGAMIASIVVHAFGLTAARPPALLFNAAQVVLGAAIGINFVGLKLLALGRMAIIGLVWTAVLLAIAAAFALLGERLLGLPFYVLLVALSPGGQAEMGLVAIAMGIEAALVATMHFFRSTSSFLLAPVAFRLLRRWL
jgi:membrane AbrB-like protein